MMEKIQVDDAKREVPILKSQEQLDTIIKEQRKFNLPFYWAKIR